MQEKLEKSLSSFFEKNYTLRNAWKIETLHTNKVLVYKIQKEIFYSLV